MTQRHASETCTAGEARSGATSRPASRKRFPAGRAAVLALACIAAACGGSTPTNPTPRPPPPPPTVRFVPEGNPGMDSIALGMSASTAETFTLVLRAAGVTDMYGYAVDLTYDPAIMMFDSAEPGTFLDGEGISVSTQVSEGPPGTLVIGQTRVGAVPGVSGGGLLLSLNFVSVAAGSTVVATANGGAVDSTGAALATRMFGGTVTVPAQTAR